MKVIRYIIYILVAAFLPTSCIWSEIVEDPVLGEGQTTVSMDIQFRPWTAALDGAETKSAGNSIKHINDLWVVIYKNDGTFFEKVKVSSDNTGRVSNYQNSELDVTESGFAESKYCHSTFDMELPLGKYRIYAIANYDLSSFTGTEEELKSIKLTWNVSNIAANNAMFGYFTDGEDGGSAPVITIDRSGKSLHAFVKRAASKVTVSFDGSNLYENIYIYLHTVQIKDIPTTCLLGKNNTPSASNQLIANGETQFLRPSGSTNQTGGIRVTKGDPTGGRDKDAVHSETADALFFYENMQGTDPNKHQYNNFESKDNKPYGTYIEVKGYYVNKNAETASQGPIIYRFMLGKNVTDDFNAERSNHYKLVLKFKNNANDPDWHIEYEPENPEISVPTPLYISYGYNETIDIPVVVNGATVNSNTTVRAEIIENPWGYPEHKYYMNSNHDGPEDGFLSFENKKGTVSITEAQRNAWAKAGSQYLSAVKPYDTDVNSAYFKVPVYTRPLILSQSLTGHNPYVSKERKAKVKFTAVVDGKTVSKVIEVIQVKRLVNPTGVWRSDNNTAPFNFRMMELNEYDVTANGIINTEFYPTISDGPWTAHIVEGADWVRIAPTGSGQWDVVDVVGGTGSEIRFDCCPAGKNNTGSVRCAVIRVTYHNNNCVHYFFMSQGVGTVDLAGTNWLNRNVDKFQHLVENPLLEGCMFKFGNPWWGIYPENNYREGYGFDQNCWGKKLYVYNGSEDAEITFEELSYNLDVGFSGDRKLFADASLKPATYTQWKALESLHRRYGVLYGDECTETKTTSEEAYSYWQVGQERGILGMYVWDESRGGNHVFFPIGSTGMGHRKVNDNAYASHYGTIDKYSHLKYAQRPLEMPEATSKVVPMYYDIWLQKGALYWYDVMYNPAVDNDGVVSNGYAHDINFYSMLLQTYGSNAVGQSDRDGNKSTDAAFIRCVQN